MRHRFASLLLMMLWCIIVVAGPVGLEQARGRAAKFMKTLNGSSLLPVERPEYAPARSINGTAPSADTPAFYVFNAEGDNGFVIVSGDDKTDEILGYAVNGSFDADNMPPNVKAWFQGYTEQIAMLETFVPQKSAGENTNQWDAIAPLSATRWNQGAPYNNNCPLHDGARSVTGCTATAMAQIMKFHEWPQDRTRSIPAYTTETEKLFVSSLRSTTFRWGEMKNSYGPNDKGDAVAELMRYCGQSIKSDYSNIMTGAFTVDVMHALKTYFGYDHNIEYKNMEFYSLSEWERLIYDELEAGRPVYHAGYSMNGGHAFLCDGYDGKGLYHFNWGWGGMYDGYFRLSLMNPESGGIGSGSSDGYSFAQEIIVGIQPPTGEELNPHYFEPFSEQLDGTTMYCFFYNPHMEVITANVGFAVIDENNNVQKVLKDCGPITLKGELSEYQVKSLDFSKDNIILPKGTYRIATVCRLMDQEQWKRVGSYQNYFQVEIDANRKVTSISQHPVIDFAVQDWKCTGNLVAGMEQNVSVTLQNKADEVSTLLYLFANKGEEMGAAHSRATVLMKRDETMELNLTFLPDSAGVYNLWLSETEDENYISKMQVQVRPAPVKPSSLSMLSCVPDKTEVSARIRIRNYGTEPYYRGIVAILLEDLYGDGYLYATERLELPGNIEPGATKEFNFKFHGADSYSECAIYVGYYKRHTDTDVTQLGNYVHFTTDETAIEGVAATPQEMSDRTVYRLDGTVADGLLQKGVYIGSRGKVIVK